MNFHGRLILASLATSIIISGYKADAISTMRLDNQTQIVVKSITSKVKDETTLYKIKYFNKWIADNVEYDISKVISLSGGVGQTAKEALMEKKSVCAGYARAFEALCKEANIPCLYVTGTSYGVGHAWNAVWVGDAWLYVDTTWNDHEGDTEKYLLKTGSTFSSSHVWQQSELDNIASIEYPDLDRPSKSANIIRYDISKLDRKSNENKYIAPLAIGLGLIVILFGALIIKVKYI